MHRGYTKRWRKRWDNEYQRDHLLFVMMEYLIDFACWEDKSVPFFWKGSMVEMVPVSRGQCFFTINGLVDFLKGPSSKVTRDMVRSRLVILEKIEFLTREKSRQYQLVTIKNYDKYNPMKESETHEKPHKGHMNPTSIPHESHMKPTLSNKDNKYNKVKEYKREGKNPPSQKRKKTATEIPENFFLTDKMIAYGQSKGMSDPAAEFDHFLAHHEKRGDRFVSWEAAWRTWCCNHKKFGGNGNGKNKIEFDTGDRRLDKNLSVAKRWLEKEEQCEKTTG